MFSQGRDQMKYLLPHFVLIAIISSSSLFGQDLPTNLGGSGSLPSTNPNLAPPPFSSPASNGLLASVTRIMLQRFRGNPRTLSHSINHRSATQYPTICHRIVRARIRRVLPHLRLKELGVSRLRCEEIRNYLSPKTPGSTGKSMIFVPTRNRSK